MSKDEWEAYYSFLLYYGIETVAGLKIKYYDYKRNEDDWLRSKDKVSYLNAQAALEEICGIKN